LAVVVGAALLLRPAAPPVEATLPVAARVGSMDTVAATLPSTTSPSTVVVHVAGAVVSPGVYTLAGGARVGDAVVAAGGPGAGADPDALNLAAALTDGSRVYVPLHGEPIAPPVALVEEVGASGPIDLNAATAEQLDSLPGVGPATAAAIVDHRELHGPFASVDDLADVRGIGPAKLDALRGLVST
jgi:competence protein ComEA